MWKETGSLTDLRVVDSYYKLRTNDRAVDNELKPTKVIVQRKLSSREKKLFLAVGFLFLLCLGLLIATVVLASRRKAEETFRSDCKTQDCLLVAASK